MWAWFYGGTKEATAAGISIAPTRANALAGVGVGTGGVHVKGA